MSVTSRGAAEGPKWIEFQECVPKTKDAKTKTWAVVTKSTVEKDRASFGGVPLGVVKWFGRWRQYAFFPEPTCVFEPTCLRDIANFIQTEMQKRRAEGR